MSVLTFFTIWIICLGAAMSPGPAVLMAARVGLSQGARYGIATSLGIAAGACFWGVTALLGLSVLFDYAPSLLTAMKLLGGCYLIYMAIQMWRHASEPLNENGPEAGQVSLLSGVRLGFLTQIANPKPAVFFGAVFISLIPPGTPAWIMGLMLACIFVGEFLWCAFVSRIFAMERTRRGYIGLKGLIDRIFGGMLGALGVKIAVF